MHTGRRGRPCLLWCFGGQPRRSSHEGHPDRDVNTPGQLGDTTTASVQSLLSGHQGGTVSVTPRLQNSLALQENGGASRSAQASQPILGVAPTPRANSLRLDSRTRVNPDGSTAQPYEDATVVARAASALMSGGSQHAQQGQRHQQGNPLLSPSLPTESQPPPQTAAHTQLSERHVAPPQALQPLPPLPSQPSPLPQQQTALHPPRWQGEDLDPRIRIPFDEIILHKVIGKGTFKTVYRGSWNNTHVAVVAMRRGGLVTEARLLQRLSTHPNLVQLYRWSTDEAGNEYLVMELLQLGSLDAVLRSIGRQLLTQTKMTIVEQVVSACVELSREGLVHGDLAARNLLVKSLEPPHIKLADFGLARPVIQTAAATTVAGSPRLAPATADDPAGSLAGGSWEADRAGTSPSVAAAHGQERLTRSPFASQPTEIVPARWASPEVLAGGQQSEAGDVWSFGVTCWEIFANGAEPYANLSNSQILAALRAGYRLDRPRGCPRELWELVLHCWAEDPSDRPRFYEIASTLRGWRQAYIRKKTAGAAVGATGAAAQAAALRQQGSAAPPRPPAAAAVGPYLSYGTGHGGQVRSAGTGSSSVAAAAAAGAMTGAGLSEAPGSTGGSAGQSAWRALTGGAAGTAVAGDSRRSHRHYGGSRDARSPQLPFGPTAAGLRSSGSGGFGAPVGQQGTAGGAFSTHLSFEINEPPITPAYTSGSSIGVVSPQGMSREHLDQVGIISGGGLGQAARADAPRQRHAAGAQDGSRRTASSSAAAAAISTTAAAAAAAAMHGAPVLGGGGGGGGGGGSGVQEVTRTTPTTGSHSSAHHVSSGNQRSSAGTRSSAGARSSAGLRSSGGGFFDVRVDKPHRLRRAATSYADLRLRNLQSAEVAEPGPSAQPNNPAATSVPAGTGGYPATASLGSPAAAAVGLRQTLAASQSSGRTPSTIIGASIFNDSVNGSNGQGDMSGQGDAQTGSNGGVSGASGGVPSSSTGSGPMHAPRPGGAGSIGMPQGPLESYHGFAAAGQVAEGSGVPWRRQVSTPVPGGGVRAPGAAAAAASGAGPSGQPTGRAATDASVAPAAAAAARSESPYIRIGDLAAPPPLPISAWAPGQRQAPPGMAMPYSLPSARPMRFEGLSRPEPISRPIGIAPTDPAAIVAGRPLLTMSLSPFGPPTMSQLYAADDLSLRGMVKVSANMIARGAATGDNTAASSSAFAGGIDSSTGGPARSMTLALPTSMMLMPSNRGSEAYIITRESVSGNASAHHATNSASQASPSDPEKGGLSRSTQGSAPRYGTAIGSGAAAGSAAAAALAAAASESAEDPGVPELMPGGLAAVSDMIPTAQLLQTTLPGTELANLMGQEGQEAAVTLDADAAAAVATVAGAVGSNTGGARTEDLDSGMQIVLPPTHLIHESQVSGGIPGCDLMSTRTSCGIDSPFFNTLSIGRGTRGSAGTGPGSAPIAGADPGPDGGAGGFAAAGAATRAGTGTGAPPPTPQAVSPQAHPNPQLQLHLAQQRLTRMLTATTRTRRGSNGSRASGSVRCYPAGGDRMSPHGSGPASGASSRGVGTPGGLPMPLFRTEPTMDPGGSPAAPSPTTSVRSARTAYSLQSTWSVRSVVAAAAAGSTAAAAGGNPAVATATAAASTAAESGERYGGVHAGVADPGQQPGTRYPPGQAAAFGAMPPTAATVGSVAAALMGGGGRSAQAQSPATGQHSTSYAAGNNSGQALPGSAMSGSAEAFLAYDGPRICLQMAPAAAGYAYAATANPAAGGPAGTGMVSGVPRMGLVDPDVLQARHLVEVLQECPRSGSDGGGVGPRLSRNLPLGSGVDPAAQRMLLVARGGYDDAGEDGESYMVHGAAAVGPPFAMPARLGGGETSHGSAHPQVHHLLLTPTWEEEEAEAMPSMQAMPMRRRVPPHLGAATGSPHYDGGGMLGPAGGGRGRAPPRPDDLLGGAAAVESAETERTPTQDELVAERQAIFDYLQTRQLQQLQQDRDW